ncbi:MAG: GNAT family N-acetyltransferase [Marmoricola sp.]
MARTSPVPLLTDGDVSLRAHSEDDVDRVLEQCRDPLSVEWTTVPTTYTRDDAKRFVREAMPGGWATDREWAFAVEYQGRFAGTMSLRNNDDGRAEVAYGAHPDVRGTGAMERALRLLLDWGFSPVEDGGRGLQCVIWWANEGNWGSRRLAWRAGFDIAPGVVRRWLPHRGKLRDAWVGTLLPEDERTPRHPWYDVPVVDLGSVRLRPLADGDEPLVVETCNDPVSRRWMRQLPDPYLPEHARTWIGRQRLGVATGQAVVWAIADPASDALLGVVNLFSLDEEDGQAELGYWVHPAARGRGVATAGARAAVRHGLLPTEDGGMGLLRVHAVAALANEPSCRALRSAGLREVGVEHAAMRIAGEPTDAMRFEAVTLPR